MSPFSPINYDNVTTMTREITFRLATRSDIPEVVALMNAQYAIKKKETYFLWQYFDTVYPTILMCAFADDNLIGMFGLQKRKLNIGLTAGQAIDLLIAPEWRNKGLFRKLGEKAFQYFTDLDLFCVLPNVNGKIACEKVFGWKTLAKIDSMCLKSERIPHQIPDETVRQEVKPTKPFVGFHYDAKVMEWRFCRNPQYMYSHITVDNRSAITKIFTYPVSGKRFGDIVYFSCDLNESKLLSTLFLKATEYLKSQGIENITTWALPHMPPYPVLKSLGFEDMPQERYFCVKVLNKKHEYLYDFVSWHLVQADAEIY